MQPDSHALDWTSSQVEARLRFGCEPSHVLLVQAPDRVGDGYVHVTPPFNPQYRLRSFIA